MEDKSWSDRRLEVRKAQCGCHVLRLYMVSKCLYVSSSVDQRCRDLPKRWSHQSRLLVPMLSILFWRTRATCLCIEPTRNGCQFVFLPGLEVLLENGSGAQWMNSPGWDGPLGLATTSCPNSRRWRTASRLIGNCQNSARVASWLPV